MARNKKNAVADDELIGAPRAVAPLCVRSAEAAAILGVAEETLNNWRRDGIGPRHAVIGRHTVVYSVDELRAYLAASRVDA